MVSQRLHVDSVTLDVETSGESSVVLPPRIVAREELPEWMKPSAGILTGYRVGYSKRGVVSSMFQLHNETINIWTHLVTGAWWLYIGLHMPFPASMGFWDRCCVYFVTVMGEAMFVCSVLAHMCSCISERANIWWWRVDYCGILSLWFGRLSFDSYFLLAHCHTTLWRASVVLSVALFAVAVPNIVMHRSTAQFIGMFAYIHLPLLYLILLADETHSEQLTQYVHLNGCAFVCAIVGFGFFSSRVPEVMMPGTFDIWGASHQWWHVFVGVGPVLSLMAGNALVEHRYGAPTMCPQSALVA